MSRSTSRGSGIRGALPNHATLEIGPHAAPSQQCPTFRSIIAELVSAAAATYIDHSCNDFDLPDTPTRRALVQAVIDSTKPDAEADDAPDYQLHASDELIHYWDYPLMGYLGERWEALALRVAAGMAIEPPLCRDELETMVSVLDMLARNEYEEYATLKDAADYSLDLSPEAQQLVEAISGRAKGGVDKRIKRTEYGVEIHTVKCLLYLSARCQALAGVSPNSGLPFGDVATLLPLPAEDSSAGEGIIAAFPRPGIGPSWLKAWKKDVAHCEEQLKSGYGGLSELKKLKQYATHSEEAGKNIGIARVGPPFRSWEGLPLTSDIWVAHRICLVENEALKTKAFNAVEWRNAFAKAYLGAFSHFNGVLLARARFPSAEREKSKTFFFVHYAALGMAMGFRDEARRMARLLLLAQRLEILSDAKYFPGTQNMLRIFADYLGEPPLKLKGEAQTHPIYTALAKHWRHPDAEALAPLLLSVCDEHTRRSVRKNWDIEVDFESFARTPVEILLVFKLREELGLANPKLDHPLMNTPLGILPKVVPFELEELLAPLVQRMRADHFDEEAILADFVAALNNQPLVAQHPLHTYSPWPVMPDTTPVKPGSPAHRIHHATRYQPGEVFCDGPDYPQMVVIPSGSFLMGDSSNNEGYEYPQRKVTLNYTFAVGKFPITQREWVALMGNNVSYHTKLGLDCPMDNLCWDNTQEYLERLRARTGQNYRLLTEAEWEYACRAGATSRFSFGDDESLLGDYAWFQHNSGGVTHPVGQKRANAWGLHDMHGNVMEWVEDWFLRNYKKVPTDGSAPPKGDRYKMMRGGSALQPALFLAAGYREPFIAVSYDYIRGFRVALSLA